MAGSVNRRRGRHRGRIEELPSGALRVVVYAGVDPVSKRRLYLRETVPAGPKADTEAEAALVRLVNDVNEKNSPRTSATVDELFTTYFDVVNKAPSSIRRDLQTYHAHIKPVLGSTRASTVDGRMLDSFYAALLHCRERCGGRKRGHTCEGLAPATVRRIHFLISAAFDRAVRWDWVPRNPADIAVPPAPSAPDPRPPTPQEAARIINAAWDDPEWGAFVWVAATTGCRRGELCALRWRDVDLTNATLTVRRSIDQDGTLLAEKDTKTHQHRRIALDPETVVVLTEHRTRIEARLDEAGATLNEDAYVFSLDIDGASPAKPSTVTQRYRRLAERLHIKTTLHKLRHYSATELISAGVDPRTVSGRLGHSGGGATTLKVYSAWVSESDQRAAKSLTGRMPSRPTTPKASAATDPRWPYEVVASKIRAEILGGMRKPGSPLPSQQELADEHQVSVSTANRAVALLKTWGLIETTPLGAAAVSYLSAKEPPADAAADPSANHDDDSTELLNLRLIYLGQVVREFSANADASDANQLGELLRGAARRHAGHKSALSDYELEVRRPDWDQLITRFAAL